LINFACNLKKMNSFKVCTCNFLTPCIVRFLSDRKRKFRITSAMMHTCFIWSFRIFFHAIAFPKSGKILSSLSEKLENFVFLTRLVSFHVAACHWSARLGQMQAVDPTAVTVAIVYTHAIIYKHARTCALTRKWVNVRAGPTSSWSIAGVYITGIYYHKYMCDINIYFK